MSFSSYKGLNSSLLDFNTDRCFNGLGLAVVTSHLDSSEDEHITNIGLTNCISDFICKATAVSLSFFGGTALGLVTEGITNHIIVDTVEVEVFHLSFHTTSGLQSTLRHLAIHHVTYESHRLRQVFHTELHAAEAGASRSDIDGHLVGLTRTQVVGTVTRSGQ